MEAASHSFPSEYCSSVERSSRGKVRGSHFLLPSLPRALSLLTLSLVLSLVPPFLLSVSSLSHVLSLSSLFRSLSPSQSLSSTPFVFRLLSCSAIPLSLQSQPFPLHFLLPLLLHPCSFPLISHWPSDLHLSLARLAHAHRYAPTPTPLLLFEKQWACTQYHVYMKLGAHTDA